MGAFYWTTYSLGYVALAGVAALTKDWITMHVIVAAPQLILVFYFWYEFTNVPHGVPYLAVIGSYLNHQDGWYRLDGLTKQRKFWNGLRGGTEKVLYIQQQTICN